MCTSTWASGEVGPLFVSIGANASGVTSKWVKQMNEKGRGLFYITQNQHRSHFMSASSTMTMYEHLYGPALDVRREKLNLQGKPALLMSDAFTGNAALHSGIALLRQKFATLYDVHLPQPQPGGWSAHGQPQAISFLLLLSFSVRKWFVPSYTYCIYWYSVSNIVRDIYIYIHIYMYSKLLVFHAIFHCNKGNCALRGVELCRISFTAFTNNATTTLWKVN